MIKFQFNIAYVHRDVALRPQRPYGDREPKTTTSTVTQLLSFEVIIEMWCPPPKKNNNNNLKNA